MYQPLRHFTSLLTREKDKTLMSELSIMKTEYEYGITGIADFIIDRSILEVKASHKTDIDPKWIFQAYLYAVMLSENHHLSNHYIDSIIIFNAHRGMYIKVFIADLIFNIEKSPLEHVISKYFPYKLSNHLYNKLKGYLTVIIPTQHVFDNEIEPEDPEDPEKELL